MMYDADESFKIDDDKKADWAISQIKDAEEERDRLISLAKSQIDDLNEQINGLKDSCDNKTGYLKALLAEYFNTVPHKETKTQESYKLLSGTLVYKKPSYKITHNDDELIKHLDGTEYVEVKKSLKWGDYKKNLTIVEGTDVVDMNTGEVIDCCTVEDVPATFNIKY